MKTHTFQCSCNSRSNRAQTFSKFGLCSAQLRKGVREVLELIVELFLDLSQLLGAEGRKVDLVLVSWSPIYHGIKD
jgi:hypothetical protein